MDDRKPLSLAEADNREFQAFGAQTASTYQKHKTASHESVCTGGKTSKGAYLLLWMVFLLGVLLGTLLLFRKESPALELLTYLLEGFFEGREGQGFLYVTGASFFSTTVWLVLVYFCGFCFIAQPVILLLVLFRGLGCGYALGMVYTQNGLSQGALLVSGLFLPMLLFTLLQLWAARTSLLLSVRLLRGTEPEHMKQRMRDYCAKYLVLWALSLVVSLLDGALSIWF